MSKNEIKAVLPAHHPSRVYATASQAEERRAGSSPEPLGPTSSTRSPRWKLEPPTWGRVSPRTLSRVGMKVGPGGDADPF